MIENLSDNELVALYQSGNSEAFEMIYERYAKTIKTISRSYFLLGGDDDDVAQEGLLGLLKAADTYDENRGATFKTYASVCIVMRIKTAIRLSHGKRSEPLNGASDIDDEVVPIPNPEDLVIDEESAKEFTDNIKGALSKFEYSVLKMYVDGLGYREIASALGKSEKAIDNALQRARKKIVKLQIKK